MARCWATFPHEAGLAGLHGHCPIKWPVSLDIFSHLFTIFFPGKAWRSQKFGIVKLTDVETIRLWENSWHNNLAEVELIRGRTGEAWKILEALDGFASR